MNSGFLSIGRLGELHTIRRATLKCTRIILTGSILPERGVPHNEVLGLSALTYRKGILRSRGILVHTSFGMSIVMAIVRQSTSALSVILFIQIILAKMQVLFISKIRLFIIDFISPDSSKLSEYICFFFKNYSQIFYCQVISVQS